MTRFADGPVRVTVPATSANLGPGFDSLGLALDLRDELVGEVTGSGLEVEVRGCRRRRRTPRRVATWSCGRCGPPSPPWTCHLPGSGSPATTRSRTAAASARRPPPSSAEPPWPARLVADGETRLDDDSLFRLAAGIEGHPDNVAPALLGGFVISGREGANFFALPSTVDPRISVVVFVPPDPVSTEVARGLLPDQVLARRRGGGRGSNGAAGRGPRRAARAPVPGHARLPAPGLPPGGDARVAGPGRPTCGTTASPRPSPEPGRPCSPSPRAGVPTAELIGALPAVVGVPAPRDRPARRTRRVTGPARRSVLPRRR